MQIVLITLSRVPETFQTRKAKLFRLSSCKRGLRSRETVCHFKITEASHSMWEADSVDIKWGRMRHDSVNVKCTALINSGDTKESEFINETYEKKARSSVL